MSERQKGTAVGAGVGAGVGAVLGSATGGKAGSGAVIGGAIGAVVGNLWSKRQEERRVVMEQATRGTGVDVTRTADNQLKVNIPSDVSFDTGSAVIKQSSVPRRRSSGSVPSAAQFSDPPQGAGSGRLQSRSSAVAQSAEL